MNIVLALRRSQSLQPVRVHRMLQAAALAAMSLPFLVSGIAAAPQPGDATTKKDYAIFLGLDLFVDQHGKRLPVVGGSDREILVREDGAEVDIPRQKVALSAILEPKLSRGGVTLASMDGFPVHSPATDPVMDAQSQLLSMQNAQANRVDAAEFARGQADLNATGANAAAANAGPWEKAETEAAAARATVEASTAEDNLVSTLANPEFQSFLPGDAKGNGVFDGFQVSFRVSASEPCADAYGVLRLILRPSTPPNAPVQQAMQVFRLPSLDDRPRKIIVHKFNLPAGTRVESYEVHIYAGGRELASNTSRNRVDVTDDEALQFLILRHMQLHAGATQPAEVAQDLRRDWPPTIAADAAKVTVNVGIGEDGKVTAVALGAAASAPSARELEQAVRDVRFLPALVNGKPAASSGTFALGELFRSAPGT